MYTEETAWGQELNLGVHHNGERRDFSCNQKGVLSDVLGSRGSGYGGYCRPRRKEDPEPPVPTCGFYAPAVKIVLPGCLTVCVHITFASRWRMRGGWGWRWGVGKRKRREEGGREDEERCRRPREKKKKY